MSEGNMQAKIHAHIDQLFQGMPAEERVSEVKLELYMNTVDRYNDLVNAGKTAEEAYEEAIAGIGDISEILESLGKPHTEQPTPPTSDHTKPPKVPKQKSSRKAIRSNLDSILWMVSLSVYFVVSFATMLWQFTWLIFLIVMAFENAMHALLDIVQGKRPERTYAFTREEKKMHGHINSILWMAVLILYFAVSFLSGAWYVSWVIFLLGTAVQNALSIVFILKKTKEVAS